MKLTPSLGHPDSPPIRSLPPATVFRWLNLGWQDIKQCGLPSLLHGIAVMVASWMILAFTLQYWPLALASISGFLLTGPIFATGLYALSRRIYQGGDPGIGVVTHAWVVASRHLLGYVMLLLLAATAWVGFTTLMFHFFVTEPINTPLDFLRYVVTQAELLFFLWTLLGGLGSALAFSLTVITMPLLVGRQVKLRDAMAISIEVVGNNPITMVAWALVILLLTGLAFVTGMVGFILIYPLLGHASWHLYRDLVDIEVLPAREEMSV